jgi:hypothetical protein
MSRWIRPPEGRKQNLLLTRLRMKNGPQLRTGRLIRIRCAEARQLGEADGMVRVVKCYCRSHDVLTAEEAEQQKRPSFVLPVDHFMNLEGLIGICEQPAAPGDLKEHAGFIGAVARPWR